MFWPAECSDSFPALKFFILLEIVVFGDKVQLKVELLQWKPNVEDFLPLWHIAIPKPSMSLLGYSNQPDKFTERQEFFGQGRVSFESTSLIPCKLSAPMWNYYPTGKFTKDFKLKSNKSCIKKGNFCDYDS